MDVLVSRRSGCSDRRKERLPRLLPPGERIVTPDRFDQAGCFWPAGTGVFKPASRASLSARNRAVFSRVAARAASYSAIACCPSRSCCSFFLKAASARSRARLASVSNLVTPFRANPLAGQTFLPEDRMPPVDVGSSTEPTTFQVVCSARTTSGTGIPCERTEMGGPTRLRQRSLAQFQEELSAIKRELAINHGNVPAAAPPSAP